MSAGDPERPLERVPAPAWLLRLWREIDARMIGESLDVIADDAELQLGVDVVTGASAIRQALMAADPSIETRHHVVACWTTGNRYVVEGRLTVTTIETGAAVTSVVGHFIEMDLYDQAKIRRWSGAVGPLG